MCGSDADTNTMTWETLDGEAVAVFQRFQAPAAERICGILAEAARALHADRTKHPCSPDISECNQRSVQVDDLTRLATVVATTAFLRADADSEKYPSLQEGMHLWSTRCGKGPQTSNPHERHDRLVANLQSVIVTGTTAFAAGRQICEEEKTAQEKLAANEKFIPELASSSCSVQGTVHLEPATQPSGHTGTVGTSFEKLILTTKPAVQFFPDSSGELALRQMVNRRGYVYRHYECDDHTVYSVLATGGGLPCPPLLAHEDWMERAACLNYMPQRKLDRVIELHTWGYEQLELSFPIIVCALGLNAYYTRGIKDRPHGTGIRVQRQSAILSQGQEFAALAYVTIEAIETHNPQRIGIYCKNGKHRSVGFAELLRRYMYPNAIVLHHCLGGALIEYCRP